MVTFGHTKIQIEERKHTVDIEILEALIFRTSSPFNVKIYVLNWHETEVRNNVDNIF